MTVNERLEAIVKNAGSIYGPDHLGVINSWVTESNGATSYLVGIVRLTTNGNHAADLDTVVRGGEDAEDRALAAMEELIHLRLMKQWREQAIRMADAYHQEKRPTLLEFVRRNKEGWAMSEDGASRYWLTDREVASVYAHPWTPSR